MLLHIIWGFYTWLSKLSECYNVYYLARPSPCVRPLHTTWLREYRKLKYLPFVAEVKVSHLKIYHRLSLANMTRSSSLFTVTKIDILYGNLYS